MKILLVGPNLEENLSLEYLASSIEYYGHIAVFGEFNSLSDKDKVVEIVNNVDIVGLSMAFQSRASEFLELACLIKKHFPQKTIVAGGHYASCAACELLENHKELDVIIIHEGERTIVQLLDYYEKLSINDMDLIKGIAYRNKNEIIINKPRYMIEDLDTLPFPRRTDKRYFIAGIPTAYMMGSRGCVNNCYYCCISTLHNLVEGIKFRQRSVENIVNEMELLYHEREIRHFVFHDDNFLVKSKQKNIKRLNELEMEINKRSLKDIGISIKCCPTDVCEEVFSILKRIGLVRVFLGIEASDDIIIASFNRRQSIYDSVKAIKMCEKFGISVQFNLMVLNPSATFKSIYKDIDFMKKHLTYPLNFCRTEIYYGTELEKIMLFQGRARGNYLAREYSLIGEKLNLFNDYFTNIFYDRCWANGSLMMRATGLDHVSAILKHHYKGTDILMLCKKIRILTKNINRKTVNFLKKLVTIIDNSDIHRVNLINEQIECFKKQEKNDLILNQTILDKVEHEVNQLILKKNGISIENNGRLIFYNNAKRLVSQTTAIFIALSITGCRNNSNGGVCEYAPPPMEVPKYKYEYADSPVEIETSDFFSIVPGAKMNGKNIITKINLMVASSDLLFKNVSIKNIDEKISINLDDIIKLNTSEIFDQYKSKINKINPNSWYFISSIKRYDTETSKLTGIESIEITELTNKND